MTRPTIDAYYLAMAALASTRGTCRRRKVGCVLVDASNRVLSIGYNGAPSGFPHCVDVPCPGADQPSGEGLEHCEAVHAEQSALVACRDVGAIHACYVTVSPCVTCAKLLLSTACRRVVFAERYAQAAAGELWLRAGREWVLSTKTSD